MNTGMDEEMEEIFRLLRQNPQDKQLMLNLLRGRRDIKEALEGLQTSKRLKKEIS